MKAARAVAVLLVLGLASAAVAKREHAPTLKGDPGQFFGPDDYPLDALRASEQGRTVAKLEVGPDGRVMSCVVGVSSGSPSLDRTTCDIALAHITFMPSTDRYGRSVAGSYTLPVRWVLPGDRLPRRSFNVIARLDVAADDRLIGCESVINGRKPMGTDSICANWGKAPPALLHRLKGEVGGVHAIVTYQHLVQFAADPAIAEVHAAPGHRVVALMRVALDVLPDGTIANKMVVEQTGMTNESSDPAEELHGFEAAGRTDKLQVTTAFSYAPAASETAR